MSIMNSIFIRIKGIKKRKQWRRINSHNFTTISRLSPTRLEDVEIGKGTYGEICICNSSQQNKLYIGNYCSIAGGVIFMLGDEHPINYISTYPFKVKCLDYPREAISKGDIIVEDDVWIANSVTIMSNVHIGQGAIIAAGAVVTKDVPPYSIVGGIPAKVIKYRFSEDIIQELLKIDFSQLTEDMIKDHIDELYTPINFKKQLEWLPKKSDVLD